MSVICVCIVLVTPSRYPNSVVVIVEDTVILPEVSDTRARLGFKSSDTTVLTPLVILFCFPAKAVSTCVLV